MIQLPVTALLVGALAGDPGALPLADATATVPRALHASVLDTVDELAKEYDAAVAAWRQSLREAADAAAKKEIRAAHPVQEYYPRFEELLSGGDLRAAVWMIANVRYTDLKRSEADAAARKLYAKVLESDLSDARAVREASERIVRDRGRVGEEQAVALLTGAFERAEDRELKASLAFTTASLYGKMKGEGNAEKSFAWFERVAEEFGDTKVGAQAADQIFVKKHLSVGGTAPTFGGTDVDGNELKLEDYRGKIVVIDFFGFW